MAHGRGIMATGLSRTCSHRATHTVETGLIYRHIIGNLLADARVRPDERRMGMRKQSRARLSDIAQKAGVSKVAVGKVLLGSGGDRVRVSEATAQRIRRIAQDLHYQPNVAARQLAGKGSKAIGVVVQLAPGDRFEFLSHLERHAGQRGYHLVISQASGGPGAYKEAVEELAIRGVDGLLCVQHSYPGEPDQLPFILSRCPNVVFNDKLESREANYVCVDRAEVVRLCVRHLAGRGCRRIGLALTDLAHSVQQARRRGYLQELAEQGLPAQEDLLWVGDQPLWPTQSDIDRTLDALVEGQKADAIIANNDYWAMGLIKGLERRGRRVPDNVAVIGFGNLLVSTLIDPELTTVDIRDGLVATRTVELLVALIEEAEPPAGRRVCVEPELIVRGSA